MNSNLLIGAVAAYILLKPSSASASGTATTNSLLQQLLNASKGGSSGGGKSPGSTSGGPSAGSGGSGGAGNGNASGVSLQDLNYDDQPAGIQAIIDAQNATDGPGITSTDSSSLGYISGDSGLSSDDASGLGLALSTAPSSDFSQYDPDDSDYYDPGYDDGDDD